MKFSTIAPLAFGLGASAAAIETRQTTKCCFGITVAGGVSGPLGQLSDGQNRVGPGYNASTFCIKDGAITDSTGRGCIITPQASQFQCDAGKTPSPVFSITGNGSILANGTSTFYACPATSYGVYNIYTAPVAGQTACKTVTLSSSNGTCANSAASSFKASSAAATSSKASSASSSKASSTSSSNLSSVSSVRTSSASSVASATATTSSKVSPVSSVKVSSASSVASASSSKASSVASSSSVRSSSASSVAPVATTSSKVSSASSSSSVRASSASSSSSVRASSASASSSVRASSASSVAPVATSSSVRTSSTSAATPVTVTVTSFVTITPVCSTSLSSSRPASVISVTSSGSKAASSSATSSKPASASSSTRAATSTIVTSIKTSSSASSVKATTSTSAAATKASSSSASSKASSSAAASSTACPANLNGPYQYPHLIIPVNSSAPTTAYGTQYFGTITPTVSSIFNFDIPASYAGKTCSLVFLFPLQSQLTTSSFTQSGAGGLDFKQLKSPATNATDYANAPAVAADLGVVAAAPGNSYTIASGACAAGQTVSYEISATGSYALHYFQDYNPSPLGLYIREC